MNSLDHVFDHAAAQEAERRRGRHCGSLGALLTRMEPDIRSDWAWENYETTIEALSREFGLEDLIEISDGRDPVMTPEHAASLGVRYTVNDTSHEELRHVPDSYDKVCFDIGGDLAGAGIAPESYDLAFSRMVFEHVRDGKAAWSNLHTLLKPGGVAFAFIPTLFAPPYVANLIIPGWLSSRIVKALYPHRSDAEDPKYPAFYDRCYSSERKMAPMLREAGFSEALIVPFYGHDYFEGLPVAREIDEALTRFAIRHDWRAFSAYAYILARK